MARTRSSRALITSSDRATARLLAASVSTDGRLVTVWAPGRKLEFGSDASRAATFANIGLRPPSWNADMSG